MPEVGPEVGPGTTPAPDLVLLDTDLARLSGRELIAQLAHRQGRPLLVLVITADDRDAGAPTLTDPPEPRSALPARHRALGWASVESATPPLDPAEPAPAPQASPDSHVDRYDTGIWVTGRRGSTRLCLDTVLWFAADRDYVRIKTETSEHLIRLSMHSLVERLDPAKFLRVHRSAIVNTDRVEGLERCANGGLKIVLGDGALVPIARSYARSVKAALLSPLRPRKAGWSQAASGVTAV